MKIISSEKKYNILNENNQLISQLWFDNIEPYGDLFKVYLEGPDYYNLLNKEGKLLSKLWYKQIFRESNGLFLVVTEDPIWCEYETYNFIDRNGTVLFKDSFTGAYSFHNGYSIVRTEKLHELFNIVNIKGEYLFKEWSQEKLHKLNEKVIETLISEKWGEDYLDLNSSYNIRNELIYGDYVGNMSLVEKSGLFNLIDDRYDLQTEWDSLSEIKKIIKEKFRPQYPRFHPGYYSLPKQIEHSFKNHPGYYGPEKDTDVPEQIKTSRGKVLVYEGYASPVLTTSNLSEIGKVYILPKKQMTLDEIKDFIEQELSNE